MARKQKKRDVPVCPHCERDAALVKGDAVYRRCRPDLVEKFFWSCQPCDAYVGCDGKSTRALGVPANAELRRARILLHDRLDAIWERADQCGLYTAEDPKAIKMIRNSARSRTYAFLAWKIGVDRTECHTAMFDLQTCRRAWVALTGVDYVHVREWYKSRNPNPEAGHVGRSAA